MGLIKAALQSTSSVIGDQFKEYITCPEMERNVIVQRGVVNHGSANKNYTPEVITNGSKIVVPEQMAMMIIDNGAIKEFSAEAGEFIYDSSSEPSIFTGNLGESIINSIKTIGSRITFGGMAAKDQRVYYVNLKTIPNNTFGTSQPARIDTDKYGIIDITFFGTYSIKVVDPVTLITNIVGTNAGNTITYEDLTGSQMKQKFATRYAQAVATIMRRDKVPFGDIVQYDDQICKEMQDVLDNDWREMYGIEVVEVATGGPINTTDESLERIHKIDDATVFSNVDLQSGLMAQATAEAMKTAAGNENGAAMGFYGMNMAQQTGGNVMGTIYQNQQDRQVNQQSVKFCSECGAPITGKFCSNCGKQVM